jgi:hypothetical protein
LKLEYLLAEMATGGIARPACFPAIKESLFISIFSNTQVVSGLCQFLLFQ